AAPSDAYSVLAREPREQLASALFEVRAILKGPSIQARCLECPPVAPAPEISREDLTFLELLRNLFG
ncbi:MAG TPA: hypothetical protein VE968_02280, partial [Sphingomicrobium sp.]|nr:hypothetical protein [Sphingomicrobium sp.]